MTRIWNVISSLVILAILAVGCTNPVDERFDEVMAVHDEVMIKMDELNLMIEKTQNLRDELEKDSINFKSEQYFRVTKNLRDLNEADSGMWAWMHEFKNPSSDDERSEEEIMNYLNVEMDKIVKVANMINKSLENAKKEFETNE